LIRSDAILPGFASAAPPEETPEETAEETAEETPEQMAGIPLHQGTNLIG